MNVIYVIKIVLFERLNPEIGRGFTWHILLRVFTVFNEKEYFIFIMFNYESFVMLHKNMAVVNFVLKRCYYVAEEDKLGVTICLYFQRKRRLIFACQFQQSNALSNTLFSPMHYLLYNNELTTTRILVQFSR